MCLCTCSKTWSVSFRWDGLGLAGISHIMHQDSDFSHSHINWRRGGQMGSYNSVRLLELIIIGAYWSQIMVPHICWLLCGYGINNSDGHLVIILLKSCPKEHQSSKILEAKCLTFQAVWAKQSKVHRSKLPCSLNTQPRKLRGCTCHCEPCTVRFINFTNQK